MPREREKMLAGEMYDPPDPELVAARARARDLCQALNATRESQEDEWRLILQPMAGDETTRALRELAARFDEVARPETGRYVDHPKPR